MRNLNLKVGINFFSHGLRANRARGHSASHPTCSSGKLARRPLLNMDTILRDGNATPRCHHLQNQAMQKQIPPVAGVSGESGSQ